MITLAASMVREDPTEKEHSGGLGALAKLYTIELTTGVTGIYKNVNDEAVMKNGNGPQPSMAEKAKLAVLEEKGKMVAILQERTPVEEWMIVRLVKTFSWVTVMLVVMALCYGISRSCIVPVVGRAFTGIFASLIALDFVPAVGFYCIHKNVAENDEQDRILRHGLLVFSALEGILTSLLYSEWALSGWAPFAAFTTAAISVAPSFVPSSLDGTDRVKLLEVSLGLGVALHIIWGLLVGFSPAFFVLVFFYTAAAFAVIQIFFSDITKEKVFTHVYQLAFVWAVLACDALVMSTMSREISETSTNSTSPSGGHRR